MDFNAYSIFLFICGISALFISLFILRKVNDTVKSYAYLTIGIAIWAIAYALELSFSDLEPILFLLKIEYLGIALLPPLWVYFILKFVGKKDLLSTRNIILLFFPGCVTLFGMWTNEFHHLHYKTYTIDYSGKIPLFAFEPGVLYILHTIYFYLLLFAGLVILLKKFMNADKVYKRQNVIIILGTFIPWFVNVLYLLGFRPMNHIDLTPFAFILTSTLIGIGLVQFRLFDIIPVARDKIFEEMQDGVIVLDTQDRIVDLNSKMKSIVQDHLNKTLEIGEAFGKFFNKEYILLSLVSNKENGKYEWNVLRKTYDIKVSALFDKSSIFSGSVLLFREVTDRKIVEDKLKSQTIELQQLNDLKNKLFSIIAHDLRNPILSLKEIMNLLNEGVITEDELKNYLPIISKNITSTSSLLENLLNWSRSQLKGERIHATSFDIKTATVIQVQLLERAALKKKIHIQNNVSGEHMVYADRDMVELVIRNLLNNAIKYCKENDRIEINSCKENNRVKICIKDTGIGIAEENINQLFGMNNFSTSGTNNETGTGLGLLLCREFIEKNKGIIWVESKLGLGSEFCFTLPIEG